GADLRVENPPVGGTGVPQDHPIVHRPRSPLLAVEDPAVRDRRLPLPAGRVHAGRDGVLMRRQIEQVDVALTAVVLLVDEAVAVEAAGPCDSLAVDLDPRLARLLHVDVVPLAI